MAMNTRHHLLYSFIYTILIWGISFCSAESFENNPTTEQNYDVLWDIPAKKLPLPQCASKEVRQLLTSINPPDLASAKTFKAPTRKQWEAWKQYSEENGKVLAQEWSKKYHVKITPHNINGVRVYSLTPQTPKYKKKLFIFLHGGGYVFGGGMSGLAEGILIAHRTGIPVLAIDYRMPPQYPYPTALNDVVAVYQHLIKEYDPASLAMGGSSSGGALTLSAVQTLKKQGLPLPAALFAGTPWSDLSKCGDSLYVNEGIDRKLVTYDGFLSAAAKLYANGQPLKTPGLSPLYGDFDAFPPTLLVTGTRDLFLSLTVMVHRKMKEAGVEADLNVFEGLSHVEYFVIPESPESIALYKQLGLFLQNHFNQDRHR